MRVLVTGGCGFIGSALLRLLHARGHEVVNLDALTYCGFRHNSEGFEHSFVHGDVCDGSTVRGALEGVEVIFHLAAESHVDRSNVDPAPFVRTNLLGTQVLCSAALAAGVRRFVHVSTDEVYGSLGASGAFHESTPYEPNSPYSASKAGADHLVRAYHATYGVPSLITNCSNNYGPYQYPEKLIPLMTLNAIEGRELPIYGDGGNVRDWLYVEDHCAGIRLALERGRIGEKYNIGGKNERTNLELVDAICAALEAAMPAAENPALRERGIAGYRDLRRFVDDRPGHDRRYAIDAGRIRSELGWRPGHDLETGLSATVRWYLENRDWCAAVQSDYDRGRLGLAGG